MRWSRWCPFSLLLIVQVVHAVFTDEVGVTDWALQSIGEYSCVIGDSVDTSVLLILSQLKDTSLLSLVNRTNGNLLTRRETDGKITDISLDSRDNIIFMTLQDSTTSQINVVNNNIYISSFEVNDKSSISSLCPVEILNWDNVIIDPETHVLQIKDPDSKLTVLTADLPANFKGLKYLTTDYAQELEVLISTEDLKYIYYHFINDKLVTSWFRDESLSNIIDYKFFNIDDHSMDVVVTELQDENKFNNIWQAYQFRIKNNLNRLITFIKLHHYSPGRMLTNFLDLDVVETESDDINGKKSKIQQLNDLKFGFKKLLVVLTSKGKLTALDMNKQGDQVWSVHSKLSYPFVNMDIAGNHLIIFNQNGDYEVWELLSTTTEPMFIKMGSFKESFPEDSCTVKEVNQMDRSYFVSFNPETCSNDEGAVVALDGFRDKTSETQFITTHDEKSVKGHIVSDSGKLIPTWQINLDNNDERIVSFAHRTNVDVVNPGVILGSRDILYKYLYPNIASYIVFNEVTKQMYINIIDTLKGEVLVSQIHDKEYIDIDYPINIIIGENWIIYSYFSLEPIPEQKINVIELYESLTPNERKSNPSNYTNPLKESVRPEFMTRSYYFSEIINKMSVSETRFDITTKAIILELENGQISFLPKLVISARRKPESEMTDEDKQEFMASPYTPIIPINDAYIVSHVRDLVFGRSSKLGSVATKLESTSIICDVGHDIFCSRITPSGPFDVLNPNFETGKLVFSILVCLVLCFILRPYVTKRKIRGMWLVHE